MEIQLPGDVKDLFQRAVQAQMRQDAVSANRLYRQMMTRALAGGGDRYDLGVLLRTLGRLGEARALLDAELKLNPDHVEARYELGLARMARGDYPGGWPLYEARRSIPAFKIMTPSLPFPEWRGEDPAGKRIVLFPEQGLGDNIQFARFALTLRDRGAQVLMLCRPSLTCLLRDSLEGVEVQAAEGSVDMGEPDYWALFGSLPGTLGLTLETLPTAPYLRAPSGGAARTTGPLRIGLVTKGSPVHQNDAHRSLNDDAAARLRTLPGEIVSLQPEDSGARDFAGTAAIIEGLDLVITVDTSVAHLAGAMGKTAFVLIPGFGTDWRWLQGRDDSPWYPSLRLFRGAVNGDWSPALGRLETAVARLTR